MLGFLQKLFTTKSWDYFTFFQNLQTWQKAKLLPPPHIFPPTIFLHRAFWENAKLIKGFTEKDGHEYEMSCYLIDDDPVYTKYIRGEKSQVISKHTIQVKYQPRSNGYYDKIVIFNGHEIFKKAVYKDKLPEKITITKLFSLHTHPAHKTPKGQIFYSFFSGIDVNTLLQSKHLALGLITDKVYLLIKTSKIKITSLPANHIVTSKFLLENGFVLYKGEFKKAVLEKITLPSNNLP